MIRLHHAPQTRSMRSLWLMHELGVEFEVVEHAFGKNLRSEAYLALNPAGRVPALEIDGDVMFETGAITEYLCERFPEAGLGRAPGSAERRDWLVWVHFSETISQHTGGADPATCGALRGPYALSDCDETGGGAVGQMLCGAGGTIGGAGVFA